MRRFLILCCGWQDWLELQGISDAILPPVDESTHPHTDTHMQALRCKDHLQYSFEQMPHWADGGVGVGTHTHTKKKKFLYPYLLNAPGCPVLCSCNTGEFNSYPDNVVNQLRVLVPPEGIHINLSIGFHLEGISDLCRGFPPFRHSFII